MVYATCRRILGDAHAAEDAAQAVFLLLLRKASRLNKQTFLGLWLYRTACFVCRETRRKERIRVKHEQGAMRSAEARRDEEREVRSAHLARRLDDLLEKLPTAQREAVVLRYLMGLTEAEAARALGCKQGTLSARISRGLDRLRESAALMGCVISVPELIRITEQVRSETAPDGFVRAVQEALLEPSRASEAARIAMEGAMRSMFWSKLNVVAAAILLAGCLGLGSGLSLNRARLEAGESEVVADVPAGRPAKGAESKERRRAPRLFVITRDKKQGLMDASGKIILSPRFDWVGTESRCRQVNGYMPVRKDNKIGFVDRFGKLVIEPTFDHVEGCYWKPLAFSEGVAPARAGTRLGYINEKGKWEIILPYEYVRPPARRRPGVRSHPSSTYPFREGMGRICRDGRYGFVNRRGEVCIPCQYEEAGDFSEGLTAVRKKGKVGYVDRAGKVVVPFRYDHAGPFSEGRAMVEANEKAGYIDKKGRMVIEPRFFEAHPFKNGLAKVSMGNDLRRRLRRMSRKGGPVPAIGWSDSYGLIDKTGRFVAGPGLGHLNKCVDEGDSGREYWMAVGKGYGFLDASGKWDPKIDLGQYRGIWLKPFSDGLAEIRVEVLVSPRKIASRTGFVDRSGKLITGWHEDWVCTTDFSEGLAAVAISKPIHREGRKVRNKWVWGYIDRTGRWVVEPRFDSAHPFSEGLACVKVGEDREKKVKGKLGFIDRTGDWAVRARFDVARSFRHGLAKVGEGGVDRSGRAPLNGYIDKSGQYVFGPVK